MAPNARAYPWGGALVVSSCIIFLGGKLTYSNSRYFRSDEGLAASPSPLLLPKRSSPTFGQNVLFRGLRQSFMKTKNKGGSCTRHHHNSKGDKRTLSALAQSTSSSAANPEGTNHNVDLYPKPVAEWNVDEVTKFFLAVGRKHRQDPLVDLLAAAEIDGAQIARFLSLPSDVVCQELTLLGFDNVWEKELIMHGLDVIRTRERVRKVDVSKWGVAEVAELLLEIGRKHRDDPLVDLLVAAEMDGVKMSLLSRLPSDLVCQELTLLGFENLWEKELVMHGLDIIRGKQKALNVAASNGY